MVSGVVNQNKQLSDAASKPRDTSHRGKLASNYSAKIASSTLSQKKNTFNSKQHVTTSGGKPVRGSYEGLSHAPSTLIQMNGSGYAAISQHGKRYSEANNPTSLNFTKNAFTSNKSYSIMNNYSSNSVEKSSSDRMSQIVKANMI